MKIRTGVISILTNEMAEQTQRTQKAWQCVAQSKKTIEAQKEIILELSKEISFMKTQLVAWHLLMESGMINFPQKMFDEETDQMLAGFKDDKEDRSMYNPDGSIKKNKLN